MNIGIMLSGTGSTYAAIAQAIQEQRIPEAKIVRVISSKASAKGLDIAQRHGHPSTLVDVKSPDHHKFICDQFTDDKVDLVVMAGYMHLWELDDRFSNKVINIHPSLIPAFCGKGMYGHHVHRAVIAKGCQFSGCTVHLVDGEYDHGKILEQRVVAVESSDTPDSLASKIGPLEKSALIEVIAQWKKSRP
jgi:formyltetrahydrofolate-dependent phosphoribosylglycinamide formyltransferase